MKSLKAIKDIKRDKTIIILLVVSLIIHMLQALQSTGYFHPDQHFSIIEFASYKLGFSSADQMAWEFPNKVRPTLQVYLFLAYYHIINLFGFGNAYTSLTILRVIVVLVNFLLFNYILLREFNEEKRLLVIFLLIVANFSWFYPYTRTLFNSENFGAIFYFGSILLYQVFKSYSIKNYHFLIIGFLLSLSFYFRFQMGFAMVGLGVWFLAFEKLPPKHILIMSSGFLLGVGLNTIIDSLYYGEFSFIPWEYWKVNIIDKRAANLGTSSFLYYLVELSLILTAPVLSIVLIYFVFRGFIKRYQNPYVMSVVFFLLFHLLVGHKEERFLFPVFGILPVILGYGIQDIFGRYQNENGKLSLNPGLKMIVIFSLVLNFAVLTVLLLIPYSQSIYFTSKLNRHFSDFGEEINIVCLERSPYQTEGKNFHGFYWHFKEGNIHFRIIEDRDKYMSMMADPAPDTYFVASFDQIKNMDTPIKPVITSSKAAYKLNQWLDNRDLFIIPEIWILYKPGKSRKPESLNNDVLSQYSIEDKLNGIYSLQSWQKSPRDSYSSKFGPGFPLYVMILSSRIGTLSPIKTNSSLFFVNTSLI